MCMRLPSLRLVELIYLGVPLDLGHGESAPSDRSNNMDCVICNEPIKPLLHPHTGEVVWEHGNNAQPVADGRCCDDCNWKVVMPKRWDDALGEHHGLDATEIRQQVDAWKEWSFPALRIVRD